MKVLFIPFYAMCPQHRNAASARFRAEWPAKYLNAAIADGRAIYSDLYEYELVIFQKAYNLKFLELAKKLKQKGIKTALDLCDAEWIGREIEIKTMIEAVDFVTASTPAIMAWVLSEFPKKQCYIIPDGHDMKYYKPGLPVKQTAGPMKYVWYGNSGTITSLKAIIDILEDTAGPKDSLTIIADERARNAVLSEKIAVKFVPWVLETVNSEIKRCNLALNPRLDNESYRVKSNNKTTMAYIIGLPCIDRLVTDREGWWQDLMKFKDVGKRQNDVLKNRQNYLKNYCMEAVAKIWLKAIQSELYG